MTTVSDVNCVDVLDAVVDGGVVEDTSMITNSDVFGDPDAARDEPLISSNVQGTANTTKRKYKRSVKGSSVATKKAKVVSSDKKGVEKPEVQDTASIAPTATDDVTDVNSSVDTVKPVDEDTPVQKVDRRRGKITDPVKLAARREQLTQMRDKALAARSANAKRARALKDAAKWKKQQEEESLLAAYNSRAVRTITDRDRLYDINALDLQASAPLSASPSKPSSDEKAAVAEASNVKITPWLRPQEQRLPKSDEFVKDATLKTPPPLPQAGDASPENIAEDNVPPSPFGGYYNKTTGWNVNLTGGRLNRYEQNSVRNTLFR